MDWFNKYIRNGGSDANPTAAAPGSSPTSDSSPTATDINSSNYLAPLEPLPMRASGASGASNFGPASPAAAGAGAVEEESWEEMYSETDNPLDTLFMDEEIPETWAYKMPDHALTALTQLEGRGSPRNLSPLHWSETCTFHAAQATVVGGAFGGVMGLMFSSLQNQAAWDPSYEKMTNRERVISGFKDMGKTFKSQAKLFAGIGLLYSAIECGIEKRQGTRNIYNSLTASCATGGLLAVRAGPMAAALGCGGFAVFTVALEYFMPGMHGDGF